MKQKKEWKVLLKNNFLSLTILILLISLVAVFAGDLVFTENKSLDINEDLNVSRDIIHKGELTTTNISATKTRLLKNPTGASHQYGYLLDLEATRFDDYQQQAFRSRVHDYVSAGSTLGWDHSAIASLIISEGGGTSSTLYSSTYGMGVAQNSTITTGIGLFVQNPYMFGYTNGSIVNLYGIKIAPYGPASGGNISVTNSYGLYLQSPSDSPLIDPIASDYGIYQESSASKNYFNGKVGIGTTTPTYPLTVVGNVSGISIWAEGNISADDYMTHTSVYDKSKGNALNFIKDVDELKTDGKIDHSKFFGYAGEFEITDYERSEVNQECEEINGEKVCRDAISYPYTKMQGAVSLGDEISLLRQAVYELKQRLDEVCSKDNSYSWC